MAASNLNVVVITGTLTRDPELRALPSGTSVCDLRVAVNTRRKNGATSEWEDKPNFFDVKVWGAQGDNCARFLSKGRPVGVQGRLEWREWETQDGQKRQAIDIIADSVQFLGGREDSGNTTFTASAAAGSSSSDVPVDERDFQAATTAVGVGDDDIPF
jgi:single-strand DNA-binding protein